MYYKQTVFLKTGRTCIIRTATGADAAGVMDCFVRTHTETDNMLTYPEERSLTEADEREFLDERAARTDSVELCAVVGGYRYSEGFLEFRDWSRAYGKLYFTCKRSRLSTA